MTIRTLANFNDESDSNLWREELREILTPEDWHEVGTAGEPAYLNNWATKTGLHFGFRKLPAINCVQIQGRLDASAATSNTQVFTLPEGYRPPQPSWHIGVAQTSGGAGARVVVGVAGAVTFYNESAAHSLYDINIIYPLT